MQLNKRNAQSLVIVLLRMHYTIDDERKRRHLTDLPNQGAGEQQGFFKLWREKACTSNFKGEAKQN